MIEFIPIYTNLFFVPQLAVTVMEFLENITSGIEKEVCVLTRMLLGMVW